MSCIFFLVSSACSFSQDVIDPYRILLIPPGGYQIYTDGYLGQTENDLRILNFSVTPVNNDPPVYFHPYSLPSPGYTGEYELDLKQHSWHQHFPYLAKTFKIEAVSFPFTTACAFEPNGCAGPGPNGISRELVMPPDLYNNQSGTWGGLSRINAYPSRGLIINGLNNNSSHNAIISKSFTAAGPFDIVTRTAFPHSVLKHTFYLHCGNNFLDDVIDSLVWYYDLTRGRSRYYPFTNTNQSGEEEHDLIYFPEILTHPEDHFYNFNTAQNNVILNYGILNYFPYHEIPAQTGCTAQGTTHPLATDQFSQSTYFQTNFYNSNLSYNTNYIFPAPYSLTTQLLRSGDGRALAGYSHSGFSIQGKVWTHIFMPKPGIKHTYYIDRPIDLVIINHDERVIYNPSEVIVDPDAGNPQANNAPLELVFPAGYTFKTILGRYPSYQQVQDAKNDPQNGWANLSDERQVPVPVNAADLPPSPGTNPAVDYPDVMWDDPNTLISDNFYNDERYGYYYLQDKSTVKVERCVKIYDARFEVNQGAALVFDDYSQLLGFENKTINGANNYGRIKIRGTGGAVLRNNADVQYVQNGIITQTNPLNYIARQTIEAGHAVDPNTDQPQGNYDVQPGADVTFEAGDVIHLTNGFQVSGGNFSAFTNNNIPDVPICYDAQRILPHQPKDNKQKSLAAMQQFAISPNPSSTGVFNIRFRNLPFNGELSVFNAMGVEVKRIENIQQNSLTVSVEGLAKGIYLFRYYERGKHETRRIVYE